MADEARAKADRISDPISRRMMYEIADSYETLAKHEASLAGVRGLLGAERRKPS
jgi:hypothetical protein